MARPHRLVRPLLTLLVLGCVAAAVRADDKWPVPVGPSHEPARFHYDAKLWKDVPKDYLDDAAACILYAGTTYLVEPDGTIETVVHDVTRLNGRKGVEKLGEYRNIAYDPAYEALTLNTAVIHKADGHDAPIEARDVQLRDVSTDYQVYDHEKQFIISFPNLEVGDTFEVEWTVVGKNPEHAGHFFTNYTFGDGTYPCVTDELRVRLPKATPFKYASFVGKIDPVRTEDKDQLLYVWKADHVLQLPLDENLPSKEDLRVGVACSTFPSWEAIGAWKQKLRKDCWICSADVRQTARDAIKGINDPVEKARALVYWMRRNIRYISTGETHDYTPHLPSEILTNRYGDCKDTSQLLAVMLREAGIKVELATLGALDDGQVLESVPSPWGTHAILVATIDGKEHWIDTTSSLAGWDFLPHDDRDRLCYVVDDAGHIRLTRTPPLTADDNRIVQETDVWVGPDGSSRCERNVRSFGSASMVERDAYLDVPVGERRRVVTAELQDANSRARLLNLDINEVTLRDFDKPVKEHLVFTIGDHFSGETDKEGSIADSKVWGKFLAYNLDYDRKTALQFYAPFESNHLYTVHIPPLFTLEDPSGDETIRSPWGEFRRKVTLNDDGVVSVEFVTRLDKVRVEPADFDEFRKFHENVSRHYRIWLTLKPTQDLADAPALEALLALAPEDSACAAALARLYVQNSKEEDARRVLRRALHYHPDDQALLEQQVKAAESANDQTDAQRELVHRFPDEAQYALELGALLVDQNQYEKAAEVLEPLTRKGAPSHRALAQYQLARSYYRRDESAEALKHLEAAEKADAETVNTARGRLLKGLVLEDLKRPEEASASFLLALTLDDKSEEALEGLVRLSLDAGKPEEALPYLRRYVAVIGDDFDGLLQAADFSLRMQRWDDAFDLASRARDQKFHEKAQRILGLVYLHRGDDAKAAEHLDKADPDDEVLRGLIQANLALGRLREAGFDAEKASKLDKPGPELTADCERVRRLLQRRLELAKQAPPPAGREADWADALDRVVCAEDAFEAGAAPDAVTALVEPSLGKGLEMGPAFALRGRAAIGKGRLTAALADAERAVKASPRDAGGYYVRGLVRLERADLPAALADLEKAGKLTESQNADVLQAWATALYSSGRLTEALDAQRKAVKLRPKNKDMADQLKALEKEAGRSDGAK